MKKRQVHTDFWFNSIQNQTSPNTRYLYIYLITCPHINLSGIFRLPDQYICLETGLSQENLNKAKQELTNLKKAFFYNGWVHITNAIKYNNNFFNSPKNQQALHNELDLVPQDIKDKLSYNSDVTIYTYPNTNHNHNTKRTTKDREKILKRINEIKKELN